MECACARKCIWGVFLQRLCVEGADVGQAAVVGLWESVERDLVHGKKGLGVQEMLGAGQSASLFLEGLAVCLFL